MNLKLKIGFRNENLQNKNNIASNMNTGILKNR